MKKAILILTIISIIITVHLAFKAINNVEIVIPNYDGYYNNQYEKKIQSNNNINSLKAEVIKINNEERAKSNFHSGLLMFLFLEAMLLFVLLIALLICIILSQKKKLKT